MKHKTKENLTIASLVGITGLAGILLTLPTVSAETEAVDTVTITVPPACSMSGTITTGNEHTATVDSGTYQADIGSTTLKTTCNDSNGFSIYAIGYTDNTYGNTKLKSSVGATSDVNTGTATSGNTSNWAMKLTAGTGTYAPTIETDTNGSFAGYHVIPSSYTKVATFASTTDATTGSTFTTTYAVFMNPTQPAGTYTGKVKYTLVHPANEEPLQPQITQSGKIHYYANASNAVGTMGEQDVASSVTLLASNYSRAGYGFAGWTNKFDYATNPTQEGIKFYGPNETISIPDTSIYTGEGKGLSLYAVWIKSAGSLQDSGKVATLCGTGTGSLTAATYDNKQDEDESTWSINAGLYSVSALTDSRDGETYAIAKLTDGKCWMIENLRLDNTAELTTLNTNNPLNDGTNVTLKHNYTDSTTHNTLSITSSVAYDETNAPDGWCTTDSAACDDQSRLRTDNTANRATGNPSVNSGSMYSYGNYYNWYSATAGRGTYSKSSGTTDGDLCPAGWHLPYGGSGTGTKGGNTTGGFYYLANSMVATTGNAINSNKHRTFPNNYLYSGRVNGGSLDFRGTNGYYWSSTAYNNNSAYNLSLSSSNVNPGTNNLNKYYGRAVRCVASS